MVGLVLSGGSAKGFAHIGVLQVLEEAGIRPGVIAGTSMGGIVGALYATGVSTDSIRSLAVGLPWAGLLTDRADPSLALADSRALDGRTLVSVPFVDGSVRVPSAVVEGRGIYRVLADLTWPWAGVRNFRSLPIPFVAVATDLETGEAVPLSGGVLADVLRATMALPGVIEPMNIGDRVLVDGGLARNLPAQDALELGADVLVCSDVSDPLADAESLGSMVDVLLQAIAFPMEASNRAERERCDILIRPDIGGMSSTDFESAAEWMARGRAAARQALATRGGEALGIARNGRRGESPPVFDPGEAIPDSVPFRGVRLEGIEAEPARRLALLVADLPTEGWLTRAGMDAALANLDASGLFQGVRYRLDANPGDTVVVIQALERRSDRVGFGLRYDDHYGAALLFNGTFSNLARFGSVTRIHARLGEEVQIQGNTLWGRGLTTPWSLGARVGWTRAPFDVREGRTTVARVAVDVASVRLLFGRTVGRAALAGLEIGGEWVRGGTIVAPTDSTQTAGIGSAAALLFRQTLDDPDFPRSGYRIYLRSEIAADGRDALRTFQQHVADILVARSPAPGVTILAGAFLGTAGGSNVPLHRRLYLGGVRSSAVFPSTQPAFLGLRPQERSGSAAQVVRAAVRWEFQSDRHITLAVDGGGVGEKWRMDRDAYTIGWGATLSAPTIIGPASLTLHGQSMRDTGLSISVGRVF